MTGSDDRPGFLRRWSARKAAAAPTPEPPPPELPPPELPPIETLTALSDFTVFLQPGVSPDIQRLALQRAWESDAAIAGFRGMAEYAWDFNAPNYGQLRPMDNVARLLADVLSPPPDPPSPEPAPPEPAALVAEAAPPVEPEPEPPPPQAEPTPAPPRRHGTALPT